jgi:hypothetical protein
VGDDGATIQILDVREDGGVAVQIWRGWSRQDLVRMEPSAIGIDPDIEEDGGVADQVMLQRRGESGYVAAAPSGYL